MKLENLLTLGNRDNTLSNLDIRGISDDSRCVGKGDLFFIIPRPSFDIFSVLTAVESQVAAFAAPRESREHLKNLIIHKPVIYLDNIEKEFERIADNFYGFTDNRLTFIGVTGTNGKSTTTYLIYQLLKKMGGLCALIGTVEYRIGGRTYKSHHTTPDFLTLRKLLKPMASSLRGFVVMEVSSHALTQARVRGIIFSRCLFTNLSRDHLDYHKTMDGYFEAKKLLFLDNPQALSIINADDSYGRKIAKFGP